jgi:hypothetical protein
MALVLEELQPGLAEYNGLAVVFTWGVAVPAPVSWRAVYSPADAASLDLPPAFVQHVGVFGESGVSLVSDQTGTFRARFLASSPTVTQIEIARLALVASAKRGGPFARPPLAIADLNAPGRTVFASTAIIEGPPRSVGFARSAPVVEYTFLCDGIVAFLPQLLPLESARVQIPGLA